MRRAACLILALASSGASADQTYPSGKVVECYCTDTQGARVELGETLCLTVNGRVFLALCDMSQNVPFWRDTGQGCLSSALPQSLIEFGQPAVEPGAVDVPVVAPVARPG